jgi:hypothetical protein
MIFPHYIICFLRVTIFDRTGKCPVLSMAWELSVLCLLPVDCATTSRPCSRGHRLHADRPQKAPHACETCMQTLSCRALNRPTGAVIRLLCGGPLIVRWSAYCAVVRLLCGDPLIVRWFAYCAVIRLLCGGPLIVRWSAYALVRLLCGGPLIVRWSAYCAVVRLCDVRLLCVGPLIVR